MKTTAPSPSPKRRRLGSKKSHDGKRRLPVTLLSGFLGAGKTTLLKQILRSKNNQLKIAIIVNDMGALNIDAKEIKKHKLIQEKQEMVEMHNGCICCTLRGDLLKTVKTLAEDENEYDYLVIESTGIAEPLPVAQTFVMDVNGNGQDDLDNHGEVNNSSGNAAGFEPLSKYARMDCLVTVLDVFNFVPILGNVENEADRRKYLGSDIDEEGMLGGEESIVQLLMDQVEFANVILLNKIDLLTKIDGKESSVEAQIEAIKALVHKLNPKSLLLIPEKSRFADFDVEKIINTGMFNMEEAQESAGWQIELEKPVHTPETEEYGISSFIFRNNERPFHPERLGRIMKNFGNGLVNEIVGKSNDKDDNNLFSGVVRLKGELWLSNADACPIEVHSAGRQLEMHPAGNGKPWMGKVLEMHPDQFRDEDSEEVWASFDLSDEAVSEIKKSSQWTDRFGDRSSELVFIGIKLDKDRLFKELNSALLTDDELNVSDVNRKKVWADAIEDPFFEGESLWNLDDVLDVEDGGEEEG